MPRKTDRLAAVPHRSILAEETLLHLMIFFGNGKKRVMLPFRTQLETGYPFKPICIQSIPNSAPESLLVPPITGQIESDSRRDGRAESCGSPNLWRRWNRRLLGSLAGEPRTCAVLLVLTSFVEREHFRHTHPGGRSAPDDRHATISYRYHRAGRPLPRNGGRAQAEPLLQQVSDQIPRRPPCQHGTDLHLPHQVIGQIDGGFHVSSLSAYWFAFAFWRSLPLSFGLDV